MGVRVGGHVGPVSASKRVSGKGCGLWLLLAIPVGLCAVYWYVALPLAVVIVVTVIALKVRGKRHAEATRSRAQGSALFAQAMRRETGHAPTQALRHPQPLLSPQATRTPVNPYPPRSVTPRPAWMGQPPTSHQPQPSFTPTRQHR